MNKKRTLFILLIIVGADCLRNVLHYFLSGESYSNSGLRNYAAVGQIFFELAVLACGIFYYKPSVKIAS